MLILGVLGPEHPTTLAIMGNLANDYAYEGNYAQAESLYRALLNVENRVMGPQQAIRVSETGPRNSPALASR
jgi:hypothetical protein